MNTGTRATCDPINALAFAAAHVAEPQCLGATTTADVERMLTAAGFLRDGRGWFENGNARVVLDDAGVATVHRIAPASRVCLWSVRCWHAPLPVIAATITAALAG